VSLIGSALVLALWLRLLQRAVRGRPHWWLAGLTASAGLAALLVLPGLFAGSAGDVLRTCLLIIVLPLMAVSTLPAGAVLPARHPRIARLLGSPLIATVVTPILLGIYFFTPLWTGVVAHDVLYLLSFPGFFALGVLLHAGLKGSVDDTTSIALGLQALLSVGELVFDAIPGLVMRLSTQVIGADYWARTPALAHHALDNQSWAGAILWFIADVSDLPIIALVVVRWMRIDAAEARHIDALLDERDRRQQEGPQA
jgi:putative copper resistance protein D